MHIKVDKFLLIAGMMAAPLAVGNCVVQNDEDDETPADGGSGGSSGTTSTGGDAGTPASTAGTGPGTAGETSTAGTAGDATVAGAGGETAAAGTGAGGETVAGGAGGAGPVAPCLGDDAPVVAGGAGGMAPVAPSCEGLAYGTMDCDPPNYVYPLGASLCFRNSWQMRPGAFAALYACLEAITDDACSPEHDAAAMACLADVRARSCADPQSATICESIVSGCDTVEQAGCEGALNALDSYYRADPETCFNATIGAVGAGGAGGAPSLTCDEVWWDVCVDGTASVE